MPRIFDTIILALIDRQSTSVTQSQLAILRMAQCAPDTPAIPKDPQHHALVAQGAKHILEEEKIAENWDGPQGPGSAPTGGSRAMPRR